MVPYSNIDLGQHWLRKWFSAIGNEPLLNTLRPRQNGRRFADDAFKSIFLNENEWILPRISLKFVPKCPINNIPALVQIMAWRRSGDKPLSEPMMVSLLTHICVTRPQWVKPILTYRQCGPGTSPGQFHKGYLSHQSLKLVWKLLYSHKIEPTSWLVTVAMAWTMENEIWSCPLWCDALTCWPHNCLQCYQRLERC